MSNPPRAEGNGLLPSSSSQRAWTVFGATGGQIGADGRGAQLARLAVGELRADRQAGEVDETEARIQFAEHFLLGLAGDLVGLGELAQTDWAGVVELVVEGTGAGLQVQVGRQVAGIGLGEGRRRNRSCG